MGQEIYSIENEKVTDGENEAPIKISDTDQVEIKKKFQDKENWKGKHEDSGAIPDDNIDWGDQVWIRLKHKKIKDLQKKINEGDNSGEDELKNLKELLGQKETEATKAITDKEAAEKARDDALQAKKTAEEERAAALEEKANEQPDGKNLKNQIEKMQKENEDQENQIKDLNNKLTAKTDEAAKEKEAKQKAETERDAEKRAKEAEKQAKEAEKQAKED